MDGGRMELTDRCVLDREVSRLELLYLPGSKSIPYRPTCPPPPPMRQKEV